MKRFLCIIFIFGVIILLCSCGVTVTETDNIVCTVTSKVDSKESTIKSMSENTTETTAAAKKTTHTDVKKTKTEKPTSRKVKKKTTEKTTAEIKKTTVTEKAKQITCTFEISCENVLNNRDSLKENKIDFLPENGKIFNSATIKVPEGSTAFDALKKVCAENTCTDNCSYCEKNGIQLDYAYTPGYDNYYIRGIHQIYEKDCGSQSGWMYSVNGVFPNYGCSEYKLKDGDTVKFLYTCNLGDDLGVTD